MIRKKHALGLDPRVETDFRSEQTKGACRVIMPTLKGSDGNSLATLGRRCMRRMWRRAIRLPSDSKSPRPASRRGLNSCDAEHMPVICPTCQISLEAGQLDCTRIAVERLTLSAKPCARSNPGAAGSLMCQAPDIPDGASDGHQRYSSRAAKPP